MSNFDDLKRLKTFREAPKGKLGGGDLLTFFLIGDIIVTNNRLPHVNGAERKGICTLTNLSQAAE